MAAKKPGKAVRKAPAKGGASAQSAALPPATAKKTVVKKAAAQKAVGKKVVAKKAVTRKAAAKQVMRSSAQASPPMAAAAPAPAPLPSNADVLNRLFAVITERRGADPASSHSARLLSRGVAKVAQKFGEESVECLIEAVAGNAEALVAESADVLYHLLVMWVAAGVQPDQVWAELARREGVSGIAEKAARPADMGTSKIP
ncbi:MAG: phosphoribosyl-ATP diphosphatase [Janthinobacterium lividum]